MKQNIITHIIYTTHIERIVLHLTAPKNLSQTMGHAKNL